MTASYRSCLKGLIPLSGISGLSFDSLFLSPFVFCFLPSPLAVQLLRKRLCLIITNKITVLLINRICDNTSDISVYTQVTQVF